MNEVTRILSAIEAGEPQPAEKRLPLGYDELRKLAADKIAQERPGQTLQATALAHEAYVWLVDMDEALRFDSHGRFLAAAAAAKAVRRILIDRARHKQTRKAGGGRHRLDLEVEPAIEEEVEDLIALDEALASRRIPIRLTASEKGVGPSKGTNLPGATHATSTFGLRRLHPQHSLAASCHAAPGRGC